MLRFDFNTRCEYTVNSKSDTLVSWNENKKAFGSRRSRRVRSNKVYIFEGEAITFSFFSSYSLEKKKAEISTILESSGQYTRTRI